MADTVKTTREVKIEALFVDGDTRTFSVKNPRTNLSSADFQALNTWMTENNVIVGDKYGGRFGRILQGSTVTKTVTTLDLEDED